jgi:hypothetical protein
MFHIKVCKLVTIEIKVNGNKLAVTIRVQNVLP